MSKKEHIVRCTGKKLQTKRKLGEDKSDWQQAAAMTDREIEEAVVSDEEATKMHIDWSNVSIEMPRPKAVLNMRIDYDVLEFFRSQGRGYQTKINAVLRSYVEQQHSKQNA